MRQCVLINGLQETGPQRGMYPQGTADNGPGQFLVLHMFEAKVTRIYFSPIDPATQSNAGPLKSLIRQDHQSCKS